MDIIGSIFLHVLTRKDKSDIFENKYSVDISRDEINEYLSTCLDPSIKSHSRLLELSNTLSNKTTADSCSHKPMRSKKKQTKDVLLFTTSQNGNSGASSYKISEISNLCKTPETLGRAPCDCLGQMHAVTNNCLICGRIVCSKEGAGPCFTCGNQIVPMNHREPRKAQPKAQNNNKKSQSSSAYDNLEKLLDQQDNQEENTKVYDDQSDYFTYENKWLSWKERRELIKPSPKPSEASPFCKVKVNIQSGEIEECNEEVEQEPREPIETKTQIKDSIEGMNIYETHRKICLSNNLNSKKNYKPLKISSKMTNSLIDKSCISNDYSLYVGVDQPLADYITHGLVPYVPLSTYLEYTGTIWVVSTNQISSTFSNACLDKSLLEKSGELSQLLYHVTGRIKICHCIFSKSLENYHDSPFPYQGKIEYFEVLKESIPFKALSGINEFPFSMQRILEALSKTNLFN